MQKGAGLSHDGGQPLPHSRYSFKPGQDVPFGGGVPFGGRVPVGGGGVPLGGLLVVVLDGH